MKTCHIVENGIPCDKPAKNRGLCHKHYKRWQLYGDPLTPPKPKIKFIELGSVFGRWLVVGPATDRSSSGCVLWNCICECGTSRPVSGKLLCSGESKSCRCYLAESTSKRFTIHGGAQAGNYHPLYNTWRGMHRRCTTPGATGYKDWGGRGITICDRWTGKNGFATFVADMGDKPSPKHSIDRVDNDGNYEPGNCRWATQSEQVANQTRRYVVCMTSGQTALVMP
jgi:hypothetical protein